MGFYPFLCFFVEKYFGRVQIIIFLWFGVTSVSYGNVDVD